MAGRNFTYVDNSNVFIEGQRLSAVVKRLPGAVNIVDAINNRVLDFAWNRECGALHSLSCGDSSETRSASLWGSRMAASVEGRVTS